MSAVDITSRIRVRPVPRVDGPYDDEVAGSAAPIDGSLALALDLPARAGVPLRLVPPAHGGARRAIASPIDSPLPDPRSWARRLAQVVAEVLAGGRSASQLSKFLSYDVLLLLERNCGRLVARGRSPAQRPSIRSVHVSRPTGCVAEVCAVIDTGARRRALAFRLEGRDGRWVCTELQFG